MIIPQMSLLRFLLLYEIYILYSAIPVESNIVYTKKQSKYMKILWIQQLSYYIGRVYIGFIEVTVIFYVII